MVDESPDAVSAVGDHIGHVGPHEGVDNENNGNEGQGRGNGTPCGFKDEEDEGDAANYVQTRGVSDPKDYLLVEDRGVDGGCGPTESQYPIQEGNGIPPTLAGSREEEETEGHGETEVHGSVNGSRWNTHPCRVEMVKGHPDGQGTGEDP